MKVTIDFRNAMGSSEKEVRYILMDALAEFQSNRGPTSEEYVDRRYPKNSHYDWLNRTEKVKQVERRKWIAEEMRCSIISVEE